MGGRNRRRDAAPTNDERGVFPSAVFTIASPNPKVERTSERRRKTLDGERQSETRASSRNMIAADVMIRISCDQKKRRGGEESGP